MDELDDPNNSYFFHTCALNSKNTLETTKFFCYFMTVKKCTILKIDVGDDDVSCRWGEGSIKNILPKLYQPVLRVV